MNKIVIAGGSGYLGKALTGYFRKNANDIVILSRGARPAKGNIRFVSWNGRDSGPWCDELNGADLLINLTGKNVNCRYTEENKREIIDSRIRSTRILAEAVNKAVNPPRVWINASSATIYEASFDQNMTESSGVIGDDFSMNVCKQWEAEFNRALTPNVRKVTARIAIVLGMNGGALPPLTNLVRTRFGGGQGDGKQFMSWLHERDFCRAMEWFAQKEKAAGIYNVTAPKPIPNREFMHHMRKSMGVSWGLSMPRLLLEIGAVIIGTETELILKSRKVYPERLLNEGFVFEFTEANEALDDLCSVAAKRNLINIS